MSIARHHAEWLSLVPVSGPFLSLPVLLEAFPQGLDAHDPEHARLLRQQFAHWEESLKKQKADPIPHQQWIKFVLTKTLEFDEDLLAEGQAIPQTLQAEMPEHHELLRPSIVINDPATGQARLLIQKYPRSQDLTSYVTGSRWKASPDTRMTELLHATGVRLGLVTNGEHWMLVDAPKGEATGYVSWYASLWLEEKITLRAFRSLLSLPRFFGVADDKTIEALLTQSASNQQEVTDQLGLQVRRAVEMLIHEIARIEHEPEMNEALRKLVSEIDEAALYESALTVMMRLVFLFCAEERELIPTKPFPVYEQNYSVSTISTQLREIADQQGEELLERRYDGWPRLLTAFRAVYGGLQHDDVHIPAYGGSLFDPDRFPFLEGRPDRRDTCGKKINDWQKEEANPLPVNNRTVLHLLEALQLLQVKVPGGGPAEARRLSFRALDIEQIGHVYEGLLDHTAKRAAEPFLGLIGKKEPEIPLNKLQQQREQGDDKLYEFLKSETGSSRKWKNYLDVELDDRQSVRLRTACGNNESLYQQVLPFALLLRNDSFGYPVVIPKDSVFVTAGTDRRSSGTHYTPRSLTEPIVQYTLEPLVYVGPAEGNPKSEWKLKSAAELLDLKICDMACGSGAFLVQAARYMSERLLEAWETAKDANPEVPGITPEGEPSTGRPSESLVPVDPEERRTYAMRIIAQRCLYGVDINPLAAEMAKLSLWLLTLAKDKPFEFLDHAIRCGDSLVGLHDLGQLTHFSLKPNDLDQPMFSGPWLDGVDEAINLRLKLEAMSAGTVEDVEAQEKLLAEAEDKIARLRYAADLLVAGEFWGENASDKQEKVRHAAVVSGHYVEKGPTDKFEQKAAKGRRGQKMFHWPLEFPEVVVSRGGFDAFVGNPPFMGGSKIGRELGNQYRTYTVAQVAYEAKGTADLCSIFLLRICELLSLNGGLGVLATDTIAEGDTRKAGLDRILLKWAIVRAVPSLPWPGMASVKISQLWIRRTPWHGTVTLDSNEVKQISAMLRSAEQTLAKPHSLHANKGIGFNGTKPYGNGFILTPDDRNALIANNESNRDVLMPYIIGEDVNSRFDQSPIRWIINFFDWPLDRENVTSGCDGPSASDYPDCLDIVYRRVKPVRDEVKRKVRRERWWQHGERASGLYSAIEGKERVLVLTKHNKHLCFVFVPNGMVYDQGIFTFAVDDFGPFAALSSSIHLAWSFAFCSSLGITARYSLSDVFETFPFPPPINSLRLVGQRYDTVRNHIMRDTEKGLTKTYNCFHDPNESSTDIQQLRELHVEMDQAVAAAYGWDDLKLGHGFHETKQGLRYTISEPARREVLGRLLKLNHERYEEEVKQGLHDKKKGAKRKSAPKKKAAKKSTRKQEATLFDMEGDE